jgi:Ca2+-binding RTX toxin-like protein
MLALSAGVAAAQFEAQDTVFCDPGPPKQCNGSPGHDVINGSNRVDAIFARGGPDLVDAGPGDDVVSSRDGGDTVQNGARNDRDRLFGNRGPDFVNGVDGDNRDTVDCGAGKDFFDADPGDKVLDNCETPF